MKWSRPPRHYHPDNRPRSISFHRPLSAVSGAPYKVIHDRSSNSAYGHYVTLVPLAAGTADVSGLTAQTRRTGTSTWISPTLQTLGGRFAYLITDTAGLYDYQASYTANSQSVTSAGTFSNSGASVITESTTAPSVLGNRVKLGYTFTGAHYTYDADDRRIRETLFQGNAVIRDTLFQGNAVIRDTRIAYDTLGRMVRIADPGHYTRYTSAKFLIDAIDSYTLIANE